MNLSADEFYEFNPNNYDMYTHDFNWYYPYTIAIYHIPCEVDYSKCPIIGSSFTTDCYHNGYYRFCLKWLCDNNIITELYAGFYTPKRNKKHELDVVWFAVTLSELEEIILFLTPDISVLKNKVDELSEMFIKFYGHDYIYTTKRTLDQTYTRPSIGKFVKCLLLESFQNKIGDHRCW